MKHTLTTFLFSISSLLGLAQRTYESGEFEYTVVESISDLNHVRISIDPASLSYQGQHISLNLGFGVMMYHFIHKFSFDAYFLQRLKPEGFAEYFYYFQPSSFDHYGLVRPHRGKEFKLSFGYTYSQTSVISTERIRLKQVGNVSYVSDMPVNEIQTKDIAIGYSHFDMPSNINSKKNTGVYMLQKTRNLVIGFSKKKFQNQVFKTDKFGTISASHYADAYLNLLIQIQNPFPNDIRRFPTNSNGVLLSGKLNSDEINALKKDLFYLPIGFVIGYEFAHMKKGWGMKLNFGVRPGYISLGPRGIVDPLTANITGSYNLISRKK